MSPSIVFAVLLTLAAARGAAGQTLSPAERWFYPNGEIHDTVWRVMTRLPVSGRSSPWRLLEVDGSPFGGTRLQLYWSYERNGLVPGTIQEWYIEPAVRTPGGIPMFRVINREVRKCLDTMADGDSLSVRPCNASSNQMWTVVPNGSGPRATFSLSSVPRNLVLEFPSNSDGGRVRLGTFRNSSDQAIQIDAFPGLVRGSPRYSTSNYELPYHIRPRNAADKNIQVQSGSRADNAPVDIFATDPAASHHRFSLYRSVTIDYYAARVTRPPGFSWDGTHFLVARHSASVRTWIARRRPHVPASSSGPASAPAGFTPPGTCCPKDDDYFYLFNANSGLTLTVRGSGGANNTPLEQNFFTGAHDQQFRFVP